MNDWKEQVKDGLKIILGIILGMFILGLFAACKTDRHIVQKSEETSSVAITRDSAKANTKVTSDVATILQNKISSEDTDVTILVFDTEKALDATTGERPIKARVTMRKRATAQILAKDSTIHQEVEAELVETNMNYQEKDSTIVSSEKKVKRGIDKLSLTDILAILAVLTLFYIGCAKLAKKLL